MGVNFRDSDPIPHLTSPLKGEELGKLALMGERRYPEGDVMRPEILDSGLRRNDEALNLETAIATAFNTENTEPQRARRKSLGSPDRRVLNAI